ncbi:hypothetical protein IE53DRAFT_156694 [Violaceomyces palustris]|uniref:Uncharacterized protein n=1 Tax=Violaceomyces palustris TaxID=1673888 RepID=A0ACD0NTU8_9BASI|nr:hypothetical protein IE53DRAFT_156694 [Violaceomyces palustris]
MVTFMSRYSRLPNNDLPSNNSEISSSKPPTAFGRARVRWALIGAAFLSLLLLLGLASSQADHPSVKSWRATASQYAGKLNPGGKWPWSGSSGGSTGQSRPQAGQEMEKWINGSGRLDLKYDDPFNPEDLTLTEDECDAFFPGLWDEIDRSVRWFTKHPNTKEYLDRVCDDGIWSHARVVVHNNRVYLKYFQQSAFTRINAALGLLQQSVITSRERLPDVEFCLSTNDWGSMGKMSLDRAPYLEDVWLMPDYGWYSWPEPGVGSYSELREKTLRVERSTKWEEKIPKLFWRGNMGVGTADRESMLGVSEKYEWNDAKPLDWGKPEEIVPMEDHCKWKFHGFPEGMTYSGRLRYLQNCKVVIVTHEPRWIQHWTHLYNADPTSPDQNIVFVPPVQGPTSEGIEVHDEKGEVSKSTTWLRLPEVMEELLNDDAKAKRIAENQWNFFRERYVSPASAACYWRKLIKGYASTQKFDVEYHGNETSYESFVLLGNKLKGQPR